MENDFSYIDHTDIPMNSRVCLYGIGKGGEESFKLLTQLRPDVNLICFADTYQTGNFMGLEILSPQDLLKQQNEYDLILVCSCYYPEIISSLNSLGIHKVAAFSWPKFYSYQFLPDEVNDLKEKIDFILKGLHSETDRELYNLLCEARVAGSSLVNLVYAAENKANFLFNNCEIFETKFQKHTGQSYFDFVDLAFVEYAVQAGVYDGSEALFLTGQDNLKMLYGFDPQGSSAIPENSANRLEQSGKFTLISKGLWELEAKADFSIDGSASFVHKISDDNESGTVSLSALTDEVKRLSIPRLDLIIADIEDSELPMLNGAMEIILRDRPQLAICFYHSKKQFIEIPLLLMHRLKDYIFKIGHYSKGTDESVLYAIPKEKFNGHKVYS